MQHRIPIDRLGPRGEAMAEAVGACVHCGFCLPTCPTYRELGEEMDSPRGRIVLMKSMLEGDLPLEEGLPYVDRCLGCVACVTACPSGVAYGELVTSFKAEAEKQRGRGWLERRLRSLMLETLSRPALLRVSARVAALGRLASPLLPERLRVALRLLPASLPRAEKLPSIIPAEGLRRARVALLRGCAQEVLAPTITRAAARVLARRGVEVLISPDQGCCGALALHAGEDDRAKRLARQNLDALLPTGVGAQDVDAILTTAAGCGSGIQDYPLLFAGDDEAERARQMSEKSLDIMAFLDQLEPLPSRLSAPVVATYQDACHLAHAQSVREAPRRVLGQIEGLELRELSDWQICCGSAGLYNVEQPEIAERLGRDKAQKLIDTGSALVISGNIGCLTQLDHHLRRLGSAIPIRHSVEILDRAELGLSL